MVALTFDDGPDPRCTPRLLDVLREHNAKATFFMVGQAAAQHPGIVEQVAGGGARLSRRHPQTAGYKPA